MSSADLVDGRKVKGATKEIEPMNVDYDDVLHLYRGWRKSENALKEKNKELSQLKNRVQQLMNSHIKFKTQMQGLENVKELTIRYTITILISSYHDGFTQRSYDYSLCDIQSSITSIYLTRRE